MAIQTRYCVSFCPEYQRTISLEYMYYTKSLNFVKSFLLRTLQKSFLPRKHEIKENTKLRQNNLTSNIFQPFVGFRVFVVFRFFYFTFFYFFFS